MFKISLKDVGENRVTKDIISHVNTWACAVDVGHVECGRILGHLNFTVTYGLGGEYVLADGSALLGSFTIVKQ